MRERKPPLQLGSGIDEAGIHGLNQSKVDWIRYPDLGGRTE
jgi:hypothetical protein